MAEQKIQCRFVIEMLGRPANYIKEIMAKLIEKIEKEKEIKILDKKLFEPKQIKDSDLYSTFTEIEVEIGEIIILWRILFTYMPSHIEIIKPENLKINKSKLEVFINELVRRLHQYDEATRKLMIEKAILEKKLRELGGREQAAMPAMVGGKMPVKKEKKSKSKLRKSKSRKSKKKTQKKKK